LRQKVAKEMQSKLSRLKRQKIREEHGEEACPKEPTKTIESMRVKDETIITDPFDEDLLGEQNVDEFAKYFKGDIKPKILMTTNRRPKRGIFHFLKEVKSAFPNCEYYERKNFLVKEIIEWGKKNGFTDLFLFYEKHGKPHSLIISHLPEGPTATFRVSSVKLRSDIINHGAMGEIT
jgi:ribosome production factor 1